MPFIVFEGGESCGKTTQANRLQEWLRDNQKVSFFTREPGGTPLAEDIRSLFKAIPSHGDAPTPLTELYMVMASRSQHVEKVIIPSLEENQFIVCDRFLDSSYAYQHILGGVDKSVVDSVAKPILKNVIPDITFVFDLDPQVANERASKRDCSEGDRLDTAKLDVYKKLNDAFLKIAKENYQYPCGRTPKRIIIDANRSVDEIQTDIRNTVTELFP